MAINQNHTFEDLDGIKCGIVEKNVKPDRVNFLKNLLELNHYTVVVVPSPPPKITPPPPTAPALAKGASTNIANAENQPTIPTEPALVKGMDASIAPASESLPTIQPQPVPAPPPMAETFTVGVTDVTFNPINAIFGRLLRTVDGHIVSLAYWQQKEEVSNDEIPYFDNNA